MFSKQVNNGHVGTFDTVPHENVGVLTDKKFRITLKNRVMEMSRTLAFRLTLVYSLVFSISSFLAFTLFYMTAVSAVNGRVDDELTEEMTDFAETFVREGLPGVIQEIEEERLSEDPETLFIRLKKSGEGHIKSTDLSSWNPLPDIRLNSADRRHHDDESKEAALPVSITTHTFSNKSYPVRIACSAIGDGLFIQTGMLLENETEMIQILRRIFYMVTTAVFFVAALAGWFMARRALSGIDDIRHTACEITRGDMSRRVPLKKRGTEIEALAIMFNQMLDHIDVLIGKMREITDNIAHDLKSPVTRIRGLAEVTLTTGTSNRTIEEYELMAASTIEECESLLELIDTMLEISETETGTSDTLFQPIDMAELVKDVCEFFEPAAQQTHVTLNLQIEDALRLNGDRKHLQRVIANLLDNALKYTPQGGIVDVTLLGAKQTRNSQHDEVVLHVKDTGIGISRKDLPYIFDRFYRCDRSRSRPGNGLGLSLVKAIVNAHNGTIHVSSTPDEGSRFEVKLPGLTASEGRDTIDFPYSQTGSLILSGT